MSRRRAIAGALAAVALGAGAWAAFAPFPEGSRAFTFVIPPGTAARMKAGGAVGVLPASIDLTVGVRDTLVLTNDDVVVHQLGPVILGPRQTYRIPFRRPGRLQYACSLHASGTLSLAIDPEPAAGLTRLRWRLTRIFQFGGVRDAPAKPPGSRAIEPRLDRGSGQPMAVVALGATVTSSGAPPRVARGARPRARSSPRS